MWEIHKSGSERGVKLFTRLNIVALLNRKRGETENTKYA